jgi:hypothetical protein
MISFFMFESGFRTGAFNHNPARGLSAAGQRIVRCLSGAATRPPGEDPKDRRPISRNSALSADYTFFYAR